jgi:hypothetical protein
MIFPYTSRGVLYAAKVSVGVSGVWHSPDADVWVAEPEQAAARTAESASAAGSNFLERNFMVLLSIDTWNS